MIDHPLRSCAALLLALGAASCVAEEPAERAEAVAQVRAEVEDTTAPGSPANVVAALLAGNIFGMQPKPGWADTLVSCPSEYAPERSIGLADYTVISTEEIGDSATVVVDAVSAVVQEASDREPGKVDAVPGPRTDTLRFSLTRNPAGIWKICGQPQEAVGFIRVGDDSRTRWSAPGGSWQRVQQTVDSIRRAASSAAADPG